MSARTSEELGNWLRDELSWRRKELTLYRKWVTKALPGEEQAIRRGAITVLYAHWEGYVKSASEMYLEFVKMRRLRYSELALNFQAVAMKGRIGAIGPTNRISLHKELISFFLERWEERSNLPTEKIVDTQSNLSIVVFRNIIDILGLEYRQEYAVREKPIIERLLELRNGIAHGEAQRVEDAEYEQLYTKIDEMLVFFCNDIDTAATLRSYRRQNESWELSAVADATMPAPLSLRYWGKRRRRR